MTWAIHLTDGWYSPTRCSPVSPKSPRRIPQAALEAAFISRLAAEDRCHLNGLARDGDAPYVTAIGRGDVADSWRDARVSGGVVLDVASGAIVCSGFFMPHSPRWHDGRLYVLNSG